jgi:two-component system nitrogen regulation sensor histidine kinase NtrY
VLKAQSSIPAQAAAQTVFGAAFAIAGVGAIALALMAVSDNPRFSPGGIMFSSLLAAVALATLGLIIWTGIRVAKRARGRKSGAPAPRLQMRFMALFAVAAVVPAVLMAGFHALVLNRGIEFWFGERVTTLVDASADLQREYPIVALEIARLQMRSAVIDLAQPDAVRGFQESRIRYNEYLSNQAIIRDFPVLYVIDSRATILARSAELENLPEFVAPNAEVFQIADEGDMGVAGVIRRDGAPDYVRLLIRLPNYPDAYLYGVWYVDFSILTAPRNAQEALNIGIAREARMREGFFLVYALAAALIFVGAVWLALSAANTVVAPVSRLVSAAERVRHGDLEVRVDTANKDDEISALGLAFNRMTEQLQGQRSALVDANAISERRRGFIEAVLSGVSAGVIGINADQRITLVNPSAAALLGLDPVDLVDQPLSEAAPVFAGVVEQAARKPDGITEQQIDLITPDGSGLHLNVRVGRDAEGGVVITFDDVTRLVAAQRNAAWRDVARRIAHEIKNPLTPIQLSAERLRRKYRDGLEEAETSTFDRCIDTIVRQVSDIGRMVDEFSSFARMPAPKMELSDLNEIARGAVFAQRVSSPNIRLPLDEAPVSVDVECDSRLASQALANILKNAAESVSARVEGEGRKADGEIAVKVYPHAGFGVIEVTDNGLGWPAADRSRLTEPYMTTREKGTGLGLAIVRRVMEDHGGRLELDEPGEGRRGAVVRLAFPLLETERDAMDASARAEA